MQEAVQKLSFFQPLKGVGQSFLACGVVLIGLAFIGTPAVAGSPPPVDAGADQVVNAGEVVTLQGSAACGFSSSCDIDYTWTQTSPTAPMVTLDSNSSGTFSATSYFNPEPAPPVTFTAPNTSGSYVFNFEVLIIAGPNTFGPISDSVIITVEAPTLATLIANVQGHVTAGTLNSGQGNSLISKLEGAETKLTQGETQSAINKLQAFINNVQALINGGTFSVAEGQSLIDTAMAIIVQIDA